MKLLYKFSVAILIFFPIFFQLGIVIYYSQPLFLADDYQLLDFIVKLQHPASVLQKFQWLIEQHNEHRILIPRLLTWLDYQMEGFINWPVLMLIGNSIWCGIIYFLWSTFRSLRLPIWYFIPVPWLLFHPIYFDNLTWTISVLQQSVIVFLLSWLVYAFSIRKFSLAIVIVLIATFTHGNGIFGFAVGVVFLSLYREWRKLVVWNLVALFTACIYFYGFVKGQSADFSASLSDPLRIVAYFFAFLGSITQSFGPYSTSAVIAGALLLGGLSWFLLPRLLANLRSGQPLDYLSRMLLGNVLFILITTLLVTISRSWLATTYIIPSRYAHYSPYLFSWAYLVILSILPKGSKSNAIAMGAVAVSMLIWVASYLNYFTKLEYQRDALRADATNWKNYLFFAQYSPPFNQNIQTEYQKVLKIGVCRLQPSLPVHFPKVKQDTSIQLTFEPSQLLIQDAHGDYPQNTLIIKNYQYQGDTPFLVLTAANKQPVWIPVYRMRNAYKRILTGQGLRKNEIMATIFTDNLPAGNYVVGIYNGDVLSLSSNHLEVSPTHTIKVY